MASTLPTKEPGVTTTPTGWWNVHPVALILGGVLIVTALFKGHEQFVEATSPSTFWESRWLAITLVEFELGLGLWLCIGSA